MNQVKTRAEIEQKYKWNLTDIFENDEKWEEAFNLIKAEIHVLKEFKGRLQDKNALKEFFKKEHNVSLISEKLFVYAKMSRDQDNGNDTYVSMCDRAYSLLMLIKTETAFVTPELTKLPDETLLSWAQEDVFKDNSLLLKEIVRNKEHLLSENTA